MGSSQIRELWFSWNIVCSHMPLCWKDVMLGNVQPLQYRAQHIEGKLGEFSSCYASSKMKVPDPFAQKVGQVTWMGTLSTIQA